MPGLSLDTGLTGSVFANGYPGYAGAAVPGASTVPEGPSTITQMAYGVPGVGGAGRKGLTAAAIGTFALVVLGFIWWSLPRLGGGTMNFHLGSFILGVAVYWAVQHFTGMGNTGKAKAS